MGFESDNDQTNGSALWEERTNGFLKAGERFYNDQGILQEPCEFGKCNVDQRSFKAYLTRWMAATSKIAPFTRATVMKRISTSAKEAVKTCTAGNTGTQCGLKWTTGSNDASTGVGEQMAVLEIVQSNLIDSAPDWVSEVKGTSSSKGDVNAGSETVDDAFLHDPVTTGDRVGAGFLTALVLIGVIGGTTVMCV